MEALIICKVGSIFVLLFCCVLLFKDFHFNHFTMVDCKPVKYVIFDMDGILLDTESIYIRTFSRILSRYGARYDDEMRLKVMGSVIKDVCTNFVKGYDLPVTVEELVKEVEADNVQNMVKAELLPGVERLVTHLKKHNIPIAIATSSSKDSFELKTQNHKRVFDLFHHILTGGSDAEVKRGKPAPDIFLICASKFPEKPSPSEVLVFEDSVNGVQAAASAGMQVVMIPDPIVPKEKRKLATKVLSSMLEFKPEEFGLPKFD